MYVKYEQSTNCADYVCWWNDGQIPRVNSRPNESRPSNIFMENLFTSFLRFFWEFLAPVITKKASFRHAKKEGVWWLVIWTHSTTKLAKSASIFLLPRMKKMYFFLLVKQCVLHTYVVLCARTKEHKCRYFLCFRDRHFHEKSTCYATPAVCWWDE